MSLMMSAASLVAAARGHCKRTARSKHFPDEEGTESPRFALPKTPLS